GGLRLLRYGGAAAGGERGGPWGRIERAGPVPAGLDLALATAVRRYEGRLPMLGRHNAADAAAPVAAAPAPQIQAETAVRGPGAARGSRDRRRLPGGGGLCPPPGRARAGAHRLPRARPRPRAAGVRLRGRP